MSTQRGNGSRTRPQKHKNKTVFKNTLHDTSHRTKIMNNIQVNDVCVRCKEIIEWKIKYKKYKLLTQPKKCVKCDQRNVKQAYHVMCTDCGRKLEVCTKCCKSKEIVSSVQVTQEELEVDAEMQALIKALPERKRRTFFRYKKNREENKEDENENTLKDDLIAKLNSLKVTDKDDDDDDVYFDDDLSDFSE